MAREEGAFWGKNCPSSPAPPPTPKKPCSGRYGRSPSSGGGRGFPSWLVNKKKTYIPLGYKGVSVFLTSGTDRWSKRQKPTADRGTRSGGQDGDREGRTGKRQAPRQRSRGSTDEKSPSQDTTGRGTWRGTWTGKPLPSGQDSGKRDRLRQTGLPRGLSGKVSGLPPCAGQKILPDAFPRDPGQDDGAFSRNRHS